MTRAELIILRGNAEKRKEEAADLGVIVAELLKLPPGQLKKVLTDEVLAVLAKYGYTE